MNKTFLDQKYEAFIFLIVLLIPPLYVSGSFMINLVTFFSIFFLIYLSKKKFFLISNYEKLFLFLVLFFLINSFFSINQNYSSIRSLSYLRFFIFFLFLSYFFYSLSYKNFKKLSLFYIIIIFFVIFDVLVQFITGYDLFGFPKDGNRLSGPFGSELIVGHFLFSFGFIAISFSYSYKIFKKNFFNSYLIPIILVNAIFLSGERNAFLCSILLLIFMVIFCKKDKIKSLLILSSSLLIAFLLIKYSSLGNRYSANSFYFNYMKNNNLTIIEKGETNYFLNNKYINKIINNPWFAHYRGAYEIFQSNKLIGSGFKTYRIECLKYEKLKNKKILCSTHPHNIYFELLSDTGIAGLFLFLTFIIYFFYIFFKKKIYLNYEQSIIFAVFFSYIFPVKPHGSLFSTNYAFSLWFIAAVCYFIKLGYDNKKKNHSLV